MKRAKNFQQTCSAGMQSRLSRKKVGRLAVTLMNTFTSRGIRRRNSTKWSLLRLWNSKADSALLQYHSHTHTTITTESLVQSFDVSGFGTRLQRITRARVNVTATR